MLPLYLEILLKIKIAELFGKVSVIEKNGIDTIPYKNIITNTKNHYNNLIGKVECKTDTNFSFYYIPIKCIENYEVKNSGMKIYSQIEICPFCFGIYLDTEEQYNYYKMMKKKAQKQDMNLDMNLDNTISDVLYTLLKEHFCFEFIKSVK